jgi:hypothetical protein
MEDEDEWEGAATFAGDCTCEHEWDEHGWGECAVDGCECEAGWDE